MVPPTMSHVHARVIRELLLPIAPNELTPMQCGTVSLHTSLLTFFTSTCPAFDGFLAMGAFTRPQISDPVCVVKVDI